MIVIGITGSIGSGKSEVAAAFHQEGAAILNADEIAKATLKKGEEGYKVLTAVFGEEINDGRGCIDKQKLASIIFSDREKLKKLNALIHPIVHNRIKEKITELRKMNPDTVIVIDAPLLIEAGFHKMVDKVILVKCSERKAFNRAAKRLGVTLEEIKKRFSSQLPFSAKKEFADVVILNDGTVQQLREKAHDLYLNITGKEEKQKK
jgi:dephospho-CoA kinase